MRLFVRATDRYLREAKEHNCENVFRRFKDEIEGRETYNVNPRRLFFGYIKKQHQNFRSIFWLHDFMIGNEQAKCLLALCILKRGDSEYERFISETTEFSDETRAQISGLKDINWSEIEKELSLESQTGRKKGSSSNQ